LKGRIHVAADHKPADLFFNLPIKNGKDCGLVFVANKPFGTNHNVKLIVLAGFSGIGTLAAARALIEDFRYLEPFGDESCVYGVVEGRFSKAAKTNIQKFRDFSWKYRKGGRWPIKAQKADSTKLRPLAINLDQEPG
jgi:hypothetical protein